MAKQHPTVIAIGKNKGHPTTKLAGKQSPKPSRSKGRLGKRVAFIRSLIGEVAGVSGYEKRIIELLKAGSLKDTKKALKVAKKSLGTHTRGKIKRENLMNLIRAQQKAAQDKKKWLLHVI